MDTRLRSEASVGGADFQIEQQRREGPGMIRGQIDNSPGQRPALQGGREWQALCCFSVCLMKKANSYARGWVSIAGLGGWCMFRETRSCAETFERGRAS